MLVVEVTVLLMLVDFVDTVASLNDLRVGYTEIPNNLGCARLVVFNLRCDQFNDLLDTSIDFFWRHDFISWVFSLLGVKYNEVLYDKPQCSDCTCCDLLFVAGLHLSILDTGKDQSGEVK